MQLKAVIYAGFAAFLVAATPSFAQSGSLQQQIASHSKQAQEFLRANKPELAAREFNAILKLDPKNVDARGNLGVLLFFQGDYPNAAQQLRQAIQRQPSLSKIQALLGMCEKRIGETDSARTNLEKAFPKVEDERLRAKTGMELIELYYGAGELDKAAGTVNILRQLKPTDIDILYVAHRIYSSLADESLLSVAMIAPRSARMHQMMAQELARQGDTEKAVAHGREALKIDPKLPGIHFELAEILNSFSDVSRQEAAEQEYIAALADNPLDQKSECRLGEIAYRRSDFKKAFAHYSRALELQPDDQEANLGLAKTLLSMNEPEKAKPLLERAVQMEPFNAITHYHLAKLYRKLGRADDARRELAEFQKLKSAKDQLKEIYDEMRLRSARQEEPDAEELK